MPIITTKPADETPANEKLPNATDASELFDARFSKLSGGDSWNGSAKAGSYRVAFTGAAKGKSPMDTTAPNVPRWS